MSGSLRRASVLVPAFNEASGIAASLQTIDATLNNSRPDYSWEIIVVDDGSTDGTAAAIELGRAQLRSDLVVVHHTVNQGLGGAIRTGLARSTGAVVVAIDSDLSYSPGIILQLLDAWERWHAHVVIASPYMPGGSTISVPPALERRSRMANRILSATATGKIFTLTGMVRAYDGAFARSLSLKAVDVDINAEIIYKTQILRGTIIEIPADLDWSGLAERAGRGKLFSNRSRWNTAKSLVVSYLFRPFLFPLLPIPVLAVLIIVSAAFGGFTAAGIFTASLITVVLLLIASLSMLQAKRYFEELFLAVFRSGVQIDAPGHPLDVEAPNHTLE